MELRYIRLNKPLINADFSVQLGGSMSIGTGGGGGIVKRMRYWCAAHVVLIDLEAADKSRPAGQVVVFVGNGEVAEVDTGA